MLYPVQSRDHALQSIAARPIHTCQGIHSSPDRQNALESLRSHDLRSSAIQTRNQASNRPTSQSSTAPGLFQSISDPWFTDSGNRAIVGSPMLHSRTVPIYSPDLDCDAVDRKARSAAQKPLKICSLQNETLNIISLKIFSLNIISPENMFRSDFKIGPRGWVGACSGAHVEELKRLLKFSKLFPRPQF